MAVTFINLVDLQIILVLLGQTERQTSQRHFLIQKIQRQSEMPPRYFQIFLLLETTRKAQLLQTTMAETLVLKLISMLTTWILTLISSISLTELRMRLLKWQDQLVQVLSYNNKYNIKGLSLLSPFSFLEKRLRFSTL